MSDAYELACRDCKKSLWVGQTQNAGYPFCFYSGEKDTMELLRNFLWEHLGHPLVMQESQLLEYDGLKANNAKTSKK